MVLEHHQQLCLNCKNDWKFFVVFSLHVLDWKLKFSNKSTFVALKHFLKFLRTCGKKFWLEKKKNQKFYGFLCTGFSVGRTLILFWLWVRPASWQILEVHSSEMNVLFLMKWPCQTLQNIPYLQNMKTYILVFSLFISCYIIYLSPNKFPSLCQQ